MHAAVGGDRQEPPAALLLRPTVAGALAAAELVAVVAVAVVVVVAVAAAEDLARGALQLFEVDRVLCLDRRVAVVILDVLLVLVEFEGGVGRCRGSG